MVFGFARQSVGRTATLGQPGVGIAVGRDVPAMVGTSAGEAGQPYAFVNDRSNGRRCTSRIGPATSRPDIASSTRRKGETVSRVFPARRVRRGVLTDDTITVMVRHPECRCDAGDNAASGRAG